MLSSVVSMTIHNEQYHRKTKIPCQCVFDPFSLPLCLSFDRYNRNLAQFKLICKFLHNFSFISFVFAHANSIQFSVSSFLFCCRLRIFFHSKFYVMHFVYHSTIYKCIYIPYYISVLRIFFSIISSSFFAY